MIERQREIRRRRQRKEKLRKLKRKLHRAAPADRPALEDKIKRTMGGRAYVPPPKA